MLVERRWRVAAQRLQKVASLATKKRFLSG
jgi:hypothetical protein